MIEFLASVEIDSSAPLLKVIRSAAGEHLLIVPHSRIFDLPADSILGSLQAPGPGNDREALPSFLAAALANTAYGEVPLDHVVAPAPQSISLNVSSSCNLSCSYCYAAQGSFQGAQPSPMSWHVTQAAIDKLLRDADPLAPITIGFLGGEPFVNRRLIHRAVHYAAAEAQLHGLDVRFSVTTNGTLLNEEDVDLLRTHRFAVTVSIDGGKEIQSLQRPAFNMTRSSYEQLVAATRSLLADPGLAQVSARATVKRGTFDLRERFEDILSIGFPEVGFAPLRATRTDEDALRDEDWPAYLSAMIELASSEVARMKRGLPIRFTNLAVALKQVHRGASSPYPCGAGGGYFSVAANGEWYACHRAIGSPEFRMGDNDGLDSSRRRDFLIERHVHSQPACRQCWARYLCSGGCHQEASARSDSSCGFVRGWLEFCIATYCEFSPEMLESLTKASALKEAGHE